ncbi:MAG: anti-sigma factor family protein [Candidatus Binatia bacterium]
MNEHKNKLGSACKTYEEDLVLYYYGDCSETEKRRVETHLRDCPLCHRFLEDLRGFLPHMARPAELPQTFWDSYYRDLLEKLDAAEERRSWWKGPLFSWTLPALGTVGVIILALGLVLAQRNRDQEKIPREILGDEAKVEFFETMDLLESLQLLEAMEDDKTERDAGQKL